MASSSVLPSLKAYRDTYNLGRNFYIWKPGLLPNGVYRVAETLRHSAITVDRDAAIRGFIDGYFSRDKNYKPEKESLEMGALAQKQQEQSSSFNPFIPADVKSYIAEHGIPFTVIAVRKSASTFKNKTREQWFLDIAFDEDVLFLLEENAENPNSVRQEMTLSFEWGTQTRDERIEAVKSELPYPNVVLVHVNTKSGNGFWNIEELEM